MIGKIELTFARMWCTIWGHAWAGAEQRGNVGVYYGCKECGKDSEPVRTGRHRWTVEDNFWNFVVKFGYAASFIGMGFCLGRIFK